MRKLFLSILVLLFIGCDEKPKNPISEYGDTMIDSYRRGQKAGEVANLDAVRKAVQAYHAVNDRYPENLNEIKDLLGSEIDLSKYDYNPENGMVNLKVSR